MTAQKLALEIASISAKQDVRQATVEDLLHYLPMRYEDRSHLARIRGPGGQPVCIRRGGCPSRRHRPTEGGPSASLRIRCTDGEDQIRAFWWNQIYLDKLFRRGTRVILFGLWKRNHYKGLYEVENPEYEVLPPVEDAEEEDDKIHTARRVPIYRKLGEIRTRQLRGIMHHVLRSLPETIEESLPAEVVARQNLVGRSAALHNAHFPAEDAPIEDYNEARSPAHGRLIFEEFFWLSIAMGVRRGERIAEPKGAIIDIDDRARSAMSSILPFTLTRAQGRASG
jgi:ATP-dependent DNA helicase RecG